MQHTAEYFEALFNSNHDPWQFRSRWYEARKRALTLACLPQARYGHAFEPGCAIGELAAALATRCDSLLVSDGSANAVAIARARLCGFSHVRVMQARVPAQWPAEKFDLIIISEFGFYLSPAKMQVLAGQTRNSLRPGGTVVACHWRAPIAGCVLDGDAVHQALDEGIGLQRVSQLLEHDMRLEVWCEDSRSVAQREGFA